MDDEPYEDEEDYEYWSPFPMKIFLTSDRKPTRIRSTKKFYMSPPV